MQVRDNKNPIFRLPRRRAVVMALAALGGSAAYADDPNPYYIGVSEALTHDSNVNRLPNNGSLVSSAYDGYPKSDTYSSTSLLGGFDQSYARQHFYAKANLAYNRYEDNTYLDNTSYGLNAGWDWASIWNLSGGFYLGANQSLAQLNGNTTVNTLSATPQKDQVRSEQYGATLNWGGAGDLGVQSAFTHSKVDYTNNSSSDSSGNSGSLGLVYHVGPTLSTGIAYRVTSTDQYALVAAPTAQNPNAISNIPYSTDGHNIDLTVNYQPTVQTGINARLSFTRQSSSDDSLGGSFSGLTGGLTGTWQATGKLNFTVNYARDAGTNGTFFNVPLTGTTTTTTTTTTGTSPQFYQNSTVANTLSIGANYAATAKIAVTGTYSYRSATITTPTGTFSSSTPVLYTYKDNLQDASLAATWAVGRVWSVGCNLLHETRDAHSNPEYAYSANVIGCSIQATLR